LEIESAFEEAHEQEITPPVQQYFEIKPSGISRISQLREAKSAVQTDFTEALRMEIPKVFFDPALS